MVGSTGAAVKRLRVAAQKGDVETIELELGASSEIIDARDGDGRTALYHAAENGQLEVVELLIRSRADINLPRFFCGKTPLDAACCWALVHSQSAKTRKTSDRCSAAAELLERNGGTRKDENDWHPAERKLWEKRKRQAAGADLYPPCTDPEQTQNSSKRKRVSQDDTLAVPKYWSISGLSNASSSGMQPKLVKLDCQSDYDYFGTRLDDSIWRCSAGHRCHWIRQAVKVSGIRRVENLDLWRKFAMTKKHSDAAAPLTPPLDKDDDSELDGTRNEVYLWHGCQANVAEVIATEGFDERCVSIETSKHLLYGTGNYFTSQACKALQYAREKDCTIFKKKCQQFICSCSEFRGRVRRCLLYCRVVLGNIHYAEGPMKGCTKPPVRQEGHCPYNSIVANPGIPKGKGKGKQEHREFVVWNHQCVQVYPEYIVDVDLKISSLHGR